MIVGHDVVSAKVSPSHHQRGMVSNASSRWKKVESFQAQCRRPAEVGLPVTTGPSTSGQEEPSGYVCGKCKVNINSL